MPVGVEKAMKKNWHSATRPSSQETTIYSPTRLGTDSAKKLSPEVKRPVKFPVCRIRVYVT
jgi:hypothetical protein